MSARAAVAAGVAGYVVGRFVGRARAWLDVLADLPDLPTDDDPVLDLPWLCADDPTVPAQRTPPEACTWCVPGHDGEPVDVAPAFRGPCAHVRAAPRVELELTRTMTDAELAGFVRTWNRNRPDDPLDYDTLRYLA